MYTVDAIQDDAVTYSVGPYPSRETAIREAIYHSFRGRVLFSRILSEQGEILATYKKGEKWTEQSEQISLLRQGCRE